MIIGSDSSQIDLAEMFNPNAQGFSAANMAYLAHCAQAIYKPDSECTEEIENIDSELAKNIRFFNSRQTGTEGFIAGDDEKIIIAFRGTSDKKDWLTDAATIQKSRFLEFAK